MLAQELHGAHVSADHHQAGCAGVDQSGDGLGDLTGVGFPAVFRALLEPALGPAAGGRACDVQFFPLDLEVQVRLIWQHRDQFRAQPVRDDDQVRHEHLGRGEQGKQPWQGGDAGAVGLAGLRKVSAVQEPVGIGEGHEGLPESVRILDEWVDRCQSRERGAVIGEASAQRCPPQRDLLSGPRLRGRGAEVDRHRWTGSREHGGRNHRNRCGAAEGSGGHHHGAVSCSVIGRCGQDGAVTSAGVPAEAQRFG